MSIQDLTEQSPPDLTEAEFATDMAQLARSARWLWIHAMHGHPKPEMPDDDLLCDFIPGADSELCMAEAVHEFARIADEIAQWVA